MREIAKLALVLVSICSFSAGALSWARSSLATRIERQSDFHVRGPALERLLGRPADELLVNKVSVDLGGVVYPVFYTMDLGEVTGLAVEAPGRGGYAGDVVVMIGVDRRSSAMLGVEVVSHGETPGVGARVEDEQFRSQWRGLRLNTPAALRRDGGEIDAITGATFTSRAVIDGTNQVLRLVHEREDEILALITTAGPATQEVER